MQIRVSEYNQLKGQVNQQNRKATGSLAVRDLSGLVSSKDIISTENLVTLFVVVSKHNKLEWQSSYEKFCEFVVSHARSGSNDICSIAKCSLVVRQKMSAELSFTALQVPRSSKVVAEDNDNALFTVTLFRRVADTFKTAARTRGFQVTATLHTCTNSRSMYLKCHPLECIPCLLLCIMPNLGDCAIWRACSTSPMLCHALSGSQDKSQSGLRFTLCDAVCELKTCR